MEIDFTDQIKQMEADEKAGYPPNCNEGYEEKDGKCVVIEGYWKKKNMANHYPGENVKRNKDGSPAKKMKKRACKPGEYRDKSGNLKKAKADEEAGYNPPTKKISSDNLESNPNFNKEDINVEEAELPLPPTKGLQNPRNMNEYYKNLYRKVKGLDSE